MEKVIKQLYCKHLLGNSIFRSTFQITKELFKDSAIPKEEIIQRGKRQMIDSLSKEIMNKKGSSITESEFQAVTEYSLQLLVINPEEFKAIVEAAIVLLPQHEIDEIRNSI